MKTEQKAPVIKTSLTTMAELVKDGHLSYDVYRKMVFDAEKQIIEECGKMEANLKRLEQLQRDIMSELDEVDEHFYIKK